MGVATDVADDEAVFSAELRAIFESTWVFVAHESQVPNAGDYWTTTLGTQPVIVSRHEDGDVYVLLNRCRHRGSVVCRVESGHSNYFRCPYHAWSYANNGDLVGMAQASGYPKDFDRSAWGLSRVNRVSVYRGLVFANLADAGPTLDEYLEPVKGHIDAWLERSPLGSIDVLPVAHKFVSERNWKQEIERTWLIDRQVVGMPADTGVGASDVRMLGFEHGHGVLEWSHGGADAGTAETGTPRAASIFIFPNLWLLETHLRVVRPRSVDSSQVAAHAYALNGLPAHVNEGRYRRHERLYGPAGLRDGAVSRLQDDEVERASGGSRRAGDPNDPLGAMYREWKRCMA